MPDIFFPLSSKTGDFFFFLMVRFFGGVWKGALVHRSSRVLVCEVLN